MKASHKEMDVMVGFQRVHLIPGDFIFGRKNAAKELRTTERSIRTSLQHLKKGQNVTIKTTNKFSIISIVNWKVYQNEDIENDQQTANKRPASDQQVTTNKNVKNVKKKEKKIFSLPNWIPQKTWDEYLEMRQKISKPITEKGKELAVKKLENIKTQTGDNPIAILEQSIFNSWQGLFPIKREGGSIYGQNKRSDGRFGVWSEKDEADVEKINRELREARAKSNT